MDRGENREEEIKEDDKAVRGADEKKIRLYNYN